MLRSSKVHGILRTPKLVVSRVSAWHTSRKNPPDTLIRNYVLSVQDYADDRGVSRLSQGRGYVLITGSPLTGSIRRLSQRYTNNRPLIPTTSSASYAGIRSLRRLHTRNFNKKQIEAADPTLSTKRKQSVANPNRPAAAAAAEAKEHNLERHNPRNINQKGNKNRINLQKSRLSAKKLYKTAKRTRSYAKAARTLDGLLNSCELRIEDGIYAINIYKRSRQPDKCVRTLEYIHSRGGRLVAQHYGPCIAAFNASGNYSKSVALYEEMQARNVQSNIIVDLTMVQVYLQTEGLEKAVSFFRNMPDSGNQLNGNTYSLLMDAFNKTGKWETAIDLYEEMAHKGVKRDTRHCNAAITAYRKGKHLVKALEIFNEMDAQGIERNTITYNCAISACGVEYKLDEAMSLFHEMKAKDIERDTITYNSIIAVCEKVGDWSKASAYLMEMEKAGITATASHTIL